MNSALRPQVLTSKFRHPMLLGLALTSLLTTTQGCAPLHLANAPFGPDSSNQYARRGDTATVADVSMNEKVYYAVKRAKLENAVVLQVIDDENPARILPLPEGDRAVYVSELLSQTGVMKKLGHVEATLYRTSSDSINGIPMEIKMGRSRDNVQPASDYALQAGDRVMVSKATNPALEMLFDGLIGN